MDKKTYEELIAENQKLKNEIEEKINEVKEKNIEITKLKIKVENQELHINALNRYIFGSRRETTPKEENIVEGVQCSIFGEQISEEVEKQVEEKTKDIIVHKKKNTKKVQSGIKKSELKNIETETREYVLEEDQLNCTECGSHLKKIGTEVVRQEIEYVPAKLKLINYVRNIYKCEKCGTEGSKKETPTIIKTKTPRALLPHSFASASLATEVIYQKYYMGVPLYRQEKVWDDRGLVLPRSMTSNWCIKLSEYYLEPIYKLMLKEIKEKNEVLHMDETTMQCNKEQGKKASSNSYMWVIASGKLEKEKGVIFNYSRSRSSEVAKSLLKDYNGILVTDGYSGYNTLSGELTHAECWAHARRYFYESVPLDEHKEMVTSSDGYQGVKFIDELFRIEKEIETLSIEQKVKERKEKSEPILENFYKWVYLMNEKYITNKKLKEALIYVQNQKEELSKFLEDGRIPLTNSRAERTIRPFAVHRKNWLFADTPEGAKANAIYYSIIESAKANRLNINKYIKYLLENLSQLEGEQKEEDIEKYLPWSKELPEEILNYEGEYKEIEFKE